MQTAKQKTAIESIERTNDVKNNVEIFEEPAREIDVLREELATERDLRARLAAEFDNYRRRIRREQSQAADARKRELLEQLILMSDDLDLAIANLDGTTDAVAEVLRMIHRRFGGMLEAHGVVGFDSEGQNFDPERHEAFDVARETENESGTVHTQLRRGYFWNGKLLRPALVIVTL
jgi:molecular chaperone GrpE